MKRYVSMMKYGLAVQYIFAFIFRLIGAQLKGVNKSNTTLETYSRVKNAAPLYNVHVPPNSKRFFVKFYIYCYCTQLHVSIIWDSDKNSWKSCSVQTLNVLYKCLNLLS